MIRLSRRDLLDISVTILVANTPISLLQGLRRSVAVSKLMRCPPGELVLYYDTITARARRSPTALGLQYAVLCAILLLARDPKHVPIDPSRLDWGESIREYLSRANIPTQEITIPLTPESTVAVEVLGSPTNATSPAMPPGGLLDQFGNPITWRNS